MAEKSIANAPSDGARVEHICDQMSETVQGEVGSGAQDFFDVGLTLRDRLRPTDRTVDVRQDTGAGVVLGAAVGKRGYGRRRGTGQRFGLAAAAFVALLPLQPLKGGLRRLVLVDEIDPAVGKALEVSEKP
jgi:hypothetical protein